MTTNGILAMVSVYHGVSPAEILGSCKQRKFVRARWAAWTMARSDGWKLDTIAAEFNRDRSTIIYGLRRHKRLAERS